MTTLSNRMNLTAAQIDELIINNAKRMAKKFSEIKREYEYKNPNERHCVSDISGGIISEDMPLDMKMSNLFAAVNNNMVIGLRYEHEVIGLRDKCQNEQKLKQAAFLFILKSGMMDNFQQFLNEYKGDIKQDLYSEMAKAI